MTLSQGKLMNETSLQI